MDFPRQVVLEPRDIWWEVNGVFNPAAIEIGGKVHLLYRAVGKDHISRFGLAIAEDGETFTRFDLPVFEGDPKSMYERLGVEDPRAHLIGRDIFITYCAVSVYPAGQQSGLRSLAGVQGEPWRVRVSALKTRDCRKFERLGVMINDIDSKDAVIIPKKYLGNYWLIHRIDPGIYISRSRNLKNWQGNLEIMAPKEPWEEFKIGAAAPPIETERGWLLPYHGVSLSGKYSVGAALLAKENPAIVLKRTKEPFMEPHFAWETRGNVSNVIFPTGYILRPGSLYLYYGAADRVVGLAKISLQSILSTLDEQTP